MMKTIEGNNINEEESNSTKLHLMCCSSMKSIDNNENFLSLGLSGPPGRPGIDGVRGQPGLKGKENTLKIHFKYTVY